MIKIFVHLTADFPIEYDISITVSAYAIRPSAIFASLSIGINDTRVIYFKHDGHQSTPI